MNIEMYIIIAAVVVLMVVWIVRRQQQLRRRAELMQEAVRNRDFTFRLPTRGLLPGERAMQEALNRLGTIVSQQVNKSEVESWERLTRVLTHEIMNATAPISSISQTLLGRADVKGTALEEGIGAINAASTHLNTFVNSYRKFQQLQPAEPVSVRLTDVAADVSILHPDMTWTLDVPKELTVTTDPTLLRQVLINLVKNAIEAGAHRMAMDTQPTAEGLRLYVSNDGEPIPAEAHKNIFIPFFTTKRTGSGIGLSLSRRIMMQQGATLELADRPHNGFHVTFIITFAPE